MKTSFQAGVDSIYNAIVGQGVTPAGKTPAQLATGIGTVATNKYNAGNSAGYTNGYNSGAVPSALHGISNKTFIGGTRDITHTFTTTGVGIVAAIADNGGDSPSSFANFVSTTCASYNVLINNVSTGDNSHACMVICDAITGNTITFRAFGNYVTIIGGVK